MLELVPAGADAELEPAAGEVVDRRRDLREDRRVAVGDAADDEAAADARRLRGESRKQRRAFEARAARVGEDREEVVEDRDPVVAERLGGLPELDVIVERRVLLAGVNAEPNLTPKDLHRVPPACAPVLRGPFWIARQCQQTGK